MKVLIIRFSAIGNVVMTVPVLDALARNNPDAEFVVLSRSFLSPLFETLPRVKFVGADIRGVHKGLVGIVKLWRELLRENVDLVVDLQCDRKSFPLSFLLRKKTFRMRRPFWNEYLLKKNGFGKSKPLKSKFEDYEAVFHKAGLTTDKGFRSIRLENPDVIEKINRVYGLKDGIWVGIAPFAKYKSKILPLRKMKEIISYFDSRDYTKIFLFGAGEVENEILRDWETCFSRVHAVHTSLNLGEELALMSRLDVMLTMDSANMQLASLVATPVVSVWGATHHFGGYLGWNQTVENVVESDLECRPCSMDGGVRCPKKRYACLESIDVDSVIKQMEKVINEEK